MQPQISNYIIVREDRAVDPVTIVSEGLMIGRAPNCELVLNHPTVSRIQAGISEINGRFYIYNLSRSNATTLNGRVIEAEQREAIADGDAVQIGPFVLYFEPRADTLTIRVTLQIAINAGDVELRGDVSSAQNQPAPRATPASLRSREEDETAGAMTVFW